MKTDELRKLSNHIRFYAELARMFPNNQAYKSSLSRLEAQRAELVNSVKRRP